MSNSLGHGGKPNTHRPDSGTGRKQDNAPNNGGTQRDGTPTNLGTAPTNPGSKFFKQQPDTSSSSMERLKFK